MSSENEIIDALTLTGLTRTEAVDLAQNLTLEEIETLLDKGDLTSSKQPEQIDGFVSALILGGITPAIAKVISHVLGDDEEVIRLLMAGQTPLIFMTQQDSKVDDKICLPKQGEVWAKEDSRRPRIPLGLHPNCLLPNTLIECPDGILAGIRVWYNGPVIEILTSNGSSLTVTPNHLLLTPQGFIAADLLRKGDQVINRCNTQWIMSSINPNNNRKPTTIKQVFDSLRKSFSMNTTLMPTSPEYLHGDARFSHGNIDIIRTNSLLSNTRKPSRFKHFFTSLFNRCYSNLPFLSSQRSFTLFFKSFLSPSDRIMSGSRQTSSFFSGRLRHTQIQGFTSPSGSDTVLSEMFVEVYPTTLKNLRKSLDRFSSIIQPNEVININVKSYSGFVYDIQTESTLYIGNSIILSNCRCFWQDPITGRNLGQF